MHGRHKGKLSWKALVSGTKPTLGPVVQIDEGRIHTHLDRVVRSNAEEMLNVPLDAEADRLCGASRYAQQRPRGHASRQL